MADTTKLVLNMSCEDGKSHNFSYSNADRNAATSDVKALIAGITANGSIFEPVPVSCNSATLVQTTSSEFDLTD